MIVLFKNKAQPGALPSNLSWSLVWSNPTCMAETLK